MNGFPTLKEIQEFFFESQLANGWCLPTGRRKSSHPSDPGYVWLEHRRGDLYWRDRYCVGVAGPDGLVPSGADGTIYFRDKPVWRINVGGAYDPEVTKVVKMALLMAYREKKFLGGRGWQRLNFGDSSRYFNEPEPASSFTAFAGREWVTSSDGQTTKGWHHYHGGLLLMNIPEG